MHLVIAILNILGMVIKTIPVVVTTVSKFIHNINPSRRVKHMDTLDIVHTRTGSMQNVLERRKVKKKEQDMFDYQRNMEYMFAKNQLNKRVGEDFRETPELLEIMEQNEIDIDFGINLLVQIYLHKRAKIDVLTGILRRHFEGNCQLTADMILLAAEVDLLDYHELRDEFVVKWYISHETAKEIEAFQYPLPLVCPPRTLLTNMDTGYLTITGSIILKDNHHDNDVCLDAINKLNKTKYRINMNTALFMKNNWKNIDKPKDGEPFSEYRKRLAAFRKYDENSKDVMAALELANNEFWLTHKYDKRGRVYCQGYHVTYQGTDWNKAVIEFAEGEYVDGF